MSTIFISGAARGIGRAIAELFLDRGWIVGAYDIDTVDYTHPNLITGVLDVTDAQSWQTTLAEFAAHSPTSTITVVVNNAGVLTSGNIADISPAAIEHQISVNCTGIALGAHAAFPHLRTGSTLVNMGSASAIFGQPTIAVYSATKFFVAGLTEALSLEWAKHHIRVIDLWPLWAKTDLSSHANAGSIKRLGVHITPNQVAHRVWEAIHPHTMAGGKTPLWGFRGRHRTLLRPPPSPHPGSPPYHPTRGPLGVDTPANVSR